MYTLEEWFIKLDLLQMLIKIIATSYTKQDMELVAHILNSLPRQYSEVVTNIEGLNNLALVDVKAKLRLFNQQRMKVEKPGELALAVYTNFKRICHTCSKQGLQLPSEENDSSQQVDNKQRSQVFQLQQTRRAHCRRLSRTQEGKKQI